MTLSWDNWVPSVYFFFFSSRRRHTRFSRDWSSDVCSSDLLAVKPHQRAVGIEDGGRIVKDAGRAPLEDRRNNHRAGFLGNAGKTLRGRARYRSEERRVGKEWRAGWVWLHEHNKEIISRRRD